jgi:hypothetical protein
MASTAEIVMKYEKEYTNIEYPESPEKPEKDPTESWTAFGKRMDLYEIQQSDYHAAIEAYYTAGNKLEARFRNELLKATGLDVHPKVNQAWAFAWDHGHSSGLSDVAYWLQEAADLLL